MVPRCEARQDDGYMRGGRPSSRRCPRLSVGTADGYGGPVRLCEEHGHEADVEGGWRFVRDEEES